MSSREPGCQAYSYGGEVRSNGGVYEIDVLDGDLAHVDMARGRSYAEVVENAREIAARHQQQQQ